MAYILKIILVLATAACAYHLRWSYAIVLLAGFVASLIMTRETDKIRVNLLLGFAVGATLWLGLTLVNIFLQSQHESEMIAMAISRLTPSMTWPMLLLTGGLPMGLMWAAGALVNHAGRGSNKRRSTSGLATMRRPIR